MSSSDAAPPRPTGRVLLGCDAPGAGFITLQEIEGRSPRWDAATESEYIERCKTKAEALARDIVAKALAKAQTEAKAIRDGARAEVDQAVAKAHDEALAAAQAELDAELGSRVATMTGLLAKLQNCGREVWAARRRDFAALSRKFAEKILKVELDARRSEILERLMDEACSSLETRRGFTLKVSAEDFETAQGLMEDVLAGRPDLANWKIVADRKLKAGAVVLETEEMLADNSVESRAALLEPFFDRLGLPDDPVQAAKVPAAAPKDAATPAPAAGDGHGA